MNEQVGSKIIQLLSLGKPDTSYKEDGQLRKNLSPIQKSLVKLGKKVIVVDGFVIYIYR